MPDNRIQARVSDDTTAWLVDRADRMMTGSHHQQAGVELGLWRGILATELRRLRFSVPELCCLADVTGGASLDAAHADNLPLMYANAFDAFRTDFDSTTLSGAYGEHHGIDEQALLDKLIRLTPTQDHALTDALSRWWSQQLDATEDGFRAVGFTFPTHPRRSVNGAHRQEGNQG